MKFRNVAETLCVPDVTDASFRFHVTKQYHYRYLTLISYQYAPHYIFKLHAEREQSISNGVNQGLTLNVAILLPQLEDSVRYCAGAFLDISGKFIAGAMWEGYRSD